MNLIAHIINLKHRRDRYEHIIEEVKKLPVHSYEVLEGINAISPKEGCLLAHQKCIEVAKSKQLPYILILEDDAVFTEDCQEVLLRAWEELQALEWDMLYLGASLQGPAYVSSPSLLKLTQAYTTHAYVINSSLYDTILNLKFGSEIDVQYAGLMQDYNVYMCDPMIAYQAASHSDIEYGYRDYTGLLFENYIKYRVQ